MNLNDVLNIIKSYSHVDIESEGKIIRKHIPTSELQSGLLKSYVSIHGSIKIIPKRMVGNAPMKVADEAIMVDKSSVETDVGLGTIETASRSNSPESELYKIMYENAKEEAREYKRKYEDALNDKHKAEIELAGSKNSGFGDIAQGLAGFAPMLLGGNQSAPLGEANQSEGKTKVEKKADPRLQAIVKNYSTLSDDNKDGIYALVVKALSNLEKIDEIISLMD